MLAFAAAVTFGLASPDAQALALGRVQVQSALGEPLRAEVDVPQITAEEIASLRANIANPQTFRNQGLEFSPALGNVTITLQRRPNGSYFLQLAGDRPVNEPFVDVILETSWSSGRVQREFTMLFDPPSLRQQPGTSIAAQTSPTAPSQAATPAPAPATARAPAPRATAPAPSQAATPAPAPATARAPAASPAPSGGEGKQVTVKAGDTAGRIAAANKPASVSLDQMLVALLRANPKAFIGNNVNRLRAGAVLDLPTGEQASSIDPGEARATLVVQSRDFNEFRRRLAQGVPTTGTPLAGREASGRVQAQVEDRRAGSTSPDRLRLSKGAVQGRTNADQIARERAARDAATRVAELNKNIGELNRLQGSTPGAAAGTGTRPGAGVPTPPGVTVPSTVTAAAPAPAPAGAPSAAARAASAPAAAAPATATAAAPASTPGSAPAAAAPAAAAPAAGAAPAAPAAAATAAPGTTAAAPAAGAAALSATPAASAAAAPASAAVAATAAAARPAARPAPPPPEPSMLEDVLQNPLIPALGVGLLAVLAGLGFYKFRQKRKTAAIDSSFLESRLQPDSFFGASGGQRIDTAEANNPTGSSMVYSPSQLDAAGDVDPVAEADVYLAYGRDLQAEEILKEALRINPQRVAIHGKLLEIYAKRRDVRAFEVVAAEAYNLTHGSGTEWEHICDLGRELDPSNPLYRGGSPGASGVAAATAAGGAAGMLARAPATAPAPTPAAASDVDLDLDFSLGDDPAPSPAPAPVAPPPVAAAPVRSPAPPPAPAMEPLEMDFSAAAPQLDLPPAKPEPTRLETPPLNVDDNSLNFTPEPVPAPPPKAAPAPAPAADSGMMEFDLGGLSLDLPGNAPAAAAPAARATPTIDPGMNLDLPPAAAAGGAMDEDADNPLATKLALAEEFNAIGDADGARSLAEEVLAEASGDLKSRAQRLLAEIG